MFFKKMFDLIPDGDYVTIKLIRSGNTITSLLFLDGISSNETLSKITCPKVWGPPEEMDESFFDEIQANIQEEVTIRSNAKEYAKSLKNTTKNNTETKTSVSTSNSIAKPSTPPPTKEELKAAQDKASQIKKSLENAENAERRKAFQYAVVLYKKVLELDPGNKKALEKITELDFEARQAPLFPSEEEKAALEGYTPQTVPTGPTPTAVPTGETPQQVPEEQPVPQGNGLPQTFEECKERFESDKPVPGEETTTEESEPFDSFEAVLTGDY